MGSSAGGDFLPAPGEVATIHHARALPTRTKTRLSRRRLQKVNLRRARPSAHLSTLRTRTIETLPQRLQVLTFVGPPRTSILKPVGGGATEEPGLVQLGCAPAVGLIPRPGHPQRLAAFESRCEEERASAGGCGCDVAPAKAAQPAGSARRRGGHERAEESSCGGGGGGGVGSSFPLHGPNVGHWSPGG